jgi:hypothetical protein
VVDLWSIYRDRIENGLLGVHSFDAGWATRQLNMRIRRWPTIPS